MILAIKRAKSDAIVQWLKPFDVKKMYVELELPSVGENFENLQFFIEIRALFKQCGKKLGDTSPWALSHRNYGLDAV